VTRLFVAIDPPDQARAEVAALCRGVEGAKWVSPAQFHVTLRFLGEVESGSPARIATALESARGTAFSVRFAGVGRFPPRRSPRILWVGLQPEEPLLGLHSKIEARLAEAGFPGDGKAFSPHLTLARLRDGASAADAARWLDRGKDFETSPFPVSRFHLYSSVLDPAGARHRREGSYELTVPAP
jgi:2'-5' RNA ligase